MNNKRRMLVSILWILLGIGLIVGALVAKMDSFWSGLGTAFLFVGALQMVRWIRYARNPEYREKVEVENKDERNRSLSAKAWAWAGYLFVLLCAVASILLRILKQELLSMAAGGAVCLIITLYWITYLILKKKY